MAMGRGGVTESVQRLGLVRVLLPLDEVGRIGVGGDRASGGGDRTPGSSGASGSCGGGCGGGCCSGGGTTCDLVGKAKLSALDLLVDTWFFW